MKNKKNKEEKNNLGLQTLGSATKETLVSYLFLLQTQT